MPYFTVMGVIADTHFQSIEAAPLPMVYLSSLQDLPVEAVFYPRDLAILTTGDPATYIAAVRQCIWSVDSEQAISSVQTLPAVVDDHLASYKLEAELFSWFAVGALLLSSIGVYGLLSYDVANRTREIGLRMALGAERKDVIGRVVGSAVRLALFGLLAGCVLSFTLVGVLRSLLYGVAGWDVSSRVVTSLTILAVVMVAAYLPARRASAIDPMTATAR